MASIDLSVVILTWNSAKHINACIDSIISDLSEHSISFELFLVDNGSTDGTQAILEGLARNDENPTTAIYLPTNMGTTHPRNLALKKARGRFIAIVDSDVSVIPGCFLPLLARLQENSELGIVAPKLIYPDGRYQKSTDIFPTLFRKLSRLFFLRSIETMEHSPPEGDVEYAISAFWVMRREILQEVGLLDEKIFYAPEDVDYCLRTWEAGYRIRFVPETMAVHDTQELSRSLRVNRMQWCHLKGMAYYFVKHRYIFRRPTFALVSMD